MRPPQLKDLLDETRTYIPPEFLFSERLKNYREQWAASTAVKVMGRILHGLTSSAFQRWRVRECDVSTPKVAFALS